MVRLTALFTSVRVLAATSVGATNSGLIETVAEPGDGSFTGPASCLPPARGAAIRRRPGSCGPAFRGRFTEK